MTELRCEDYVERDTQCLLFRCDSPPFCPASEVKTARWSKARRCTKWRCSTDPDEDPDDEVKKVLRV